MCNCRYQAFMQSFELIQDRRTFLKIVHTFFTTIFALILSILVEDYNFQNQFQQTEEDFSCEKDYVFVALWKDFQKQPLRGVLEKRCSENVQQIYRRTPMPKCDFNKVEIALRHGCSTVNLLHIFRTSFQQNTSERLLLDFTDYPLLKTHQINNQKRFVTTKTKN